jgi:serine protease AprX
VTDSRLVRQICLHVGLNTLLCYYEPDDLERLRRQPYVLYANVLHKDLKINFHLQEKLQADAQRNAPGREQGNASETLEPTTYDVYIVLQSHTDQGPAQLLKHMVTNMGVTRDHVWVDGDDLHAILRPEDIVQLAQLDEVRGIEEVGELELFNNLARGILRTPPVTEPTNLASRASSAASTASSGSKPLPTTFDGKGQVIVVCDSGFDTGDDKTYHAAFKGRLALGTAISRPDDWSDLSGHGTHVAGTALGNQPFISVSTDYDGENFDGQIMGIAPAASLAVQCIMNSPVQNTTWKNPSTGKEFTNTDYNSGRIVFPADYPRAKIYQDAYDLKVRGGARILNCSWGKATETNQVAYNKGATNVDFFVKDNPDFLIVRAAGNEGDSQWTDRTAQIQAESVAKNSLVVGACYSNRKLNQGDTTDPPAFTKYDKQGQARLDTHIPRFSNRGPPKGNTGILKPDLIAPGVAIWSTKSSKAMTPSKGGTSPTTTLDFGTGTSMAAPMVSGAAALLRQALATRSRFGSLGEPVDELITNPTAALLKALLVNCAVDLSLGGGRLMAGNNKISDGTLKEKFSGSAEDQPYGRPLGRAPDNVQGWGRVDIAASVDNARDTVSGGVFEARRNPVDETKPLIADDRLLQSGNARVIWATVPAPAPNYEATFTVTLAWTDYGGIMLQNALILSANFLRQDNEGNTLEENLITNSGTAMAKNNVQRISLGGFQTKWKVHIIVYALLLVADPRPAKASLGVQPQDFALAWRTTYSLKGATEEKKAN